jgi:hypothetical protein
MQNAAATALLAVSLVVNGKAVSRCACHRTPKIVSLEGDE